MAFYSWRSAVKGYFHLNACSFSLISHFLFVLFLIWLRFATIVKALFLKSLFILENLIIKSHRWQKNKYSIKKLPGKWMLLWVVTFIIQSCKCEVPIDMSYLFFRLSQSAAPHRQLTACFRNCCLEESDLRNKTWPISTLDLMAFSPFMEIS